MLETRTYPGLPIRTNFGEVQGRIVVAVGDLLPWMDSEMG
jgi:hypothetical protein